VIAENLRLLFQLYVRPRRALSGIIDEGSLLFGAAAVLAVSVISSAGMAAQWLWAPPAVPAAGPAAPSAGPGGDEAGPVMPVADPWSRQVSLAFLSFGTTLTTVFVLALLYAPATLLLVTLVHPIGSFGVAFRRDFGPFLACTLLCWTAARLPFALAALTLGALPQWAAPLAAAGLWVAGLAYFAVLMVLAVRTVFGAGWGGAVAAVGLSWLSLALTPFLGFLASPFLLYLGWRYFSGDIGDVAGAFGARQSFKRYLQAATLNPRDAGAHYQLGLIHQQRHQYKEAQERFARAVEIDPAELDARYQLGRLARAEGRHQEALEHFEKVVARDPAHAHHEVWREIGATYLEGGNAEHGRWALDRYVPQRPHDPEGLFHMGEALERLGEVEKAREQFRLCVEAVETTPRYRRHEVRRWGKAARTHLGL
jgi:tetratricopeptide (TPR) repeat protein